MNKIRKQIYIEAWQEERLAELSSKLDISEAEIIRKALEAYLLVLDELPADHPLSALAGIGSSKDNDSSAGEHDKLIYRI